jgi:hypothetical protein
MKFTKYSLLLIPFLLTSCEWFKKTVNPTTSTLPEFDTNPSVTSIAGGVVDEASGIADSQNIAGHIWTMEDGLNPTEIELISHSGQLAKKFFIPYPNRDWEDIGIGPGPQNGVNYLYLADIGDNATQWNENYIYRFPEPKSINEEIGNIEKITFKYPDGKYDAECILIDPATKDIFIITKGQFNERLYKIPFPQSTTELITAQFMRTIPYNVITGGSVSPDGKQIIIRSYFVLSYFAKKDSESFADALGRESDLKLPYTFEPQGEGVAFDKDGKGYFTISEAANGKTGTNLYYYSRKK